MFFFQHFQHTAAKARASNIFLVPQAHCFVLNIYMCLEKCCLPHTAAKDRASDFFLQVYMIFPPLAAHSC